MENNQQNSPDISLNSQVKDNETAEIFKKYEHLKISSSNPISAPIPIISIAGCPIGTAGNIVVLSGSPKAGKSSVSNVLLAGAINPIGNVYDGFEGLEIAENVNQRAVIHLDLEQSRHQHFKSFANGVLKRTNLTEEPDYFLSYNLRELDVKNYPHVFKDLLKAANNLFGGIHLIVVDGGADFLKSVNDEQSSNALVHFFEQIAVKYKTTIVIIIHFNPNSEKQRGHLGSQLQRKAESVLAVKRNGNVSYIEPQFLRGADGTDIPQIQFQFDKQKGYHISTGFLLKTSKEDSILNQLKEWATKVFSSSAITYKVAVENLMEVSNLADRSVKTKIKEMLTHQLICKTDIGLYILNESEIDL